MSQDHSPYSPNIRALNNSVKHTNSSAAYAVIFFLLFTRTVQANPITVLDLESAIAVALQSNLTLASATTEILSANINQQQVAAESGIQIRPIASFNNVSGSITSRVGVAADKQLRSGARVSAQVFNKDGGSDNNTGILRVEVTQPLRSLFSTAPRSVNAKIAAIQVEIAKLRFSLKRTETVVMTVNAYLDVLLQEQLLANAKDAKARTELFHKNVKTKEKLGRATIGDTLAVEISLNQSATALAGAHSRLEPARQSLRSILNLPRSNELLLGPVDIKQHAAPEVADATRFAINHRAEYSVASRLLELARLQLQTTRGDLLPDIQLRASIDQRLLGDQSDSGEENYFIGINSQTTLNKHSARAAESRALVALQRANFDLDLIKQKVGSEVIKAQAELNNAVNALTADRKNANIARQQYAAIERLYDAGRVSSDRVNSSDSVLRQTASALVVSRANIIRTVFEYRRSLGLLDTAPTADH